ncbi:hypothetical protein HZ326_30594 [Fusarium oxysporum f. sp. albedinis]|nr:hypothetical protein HZ326_30594 [Fusarium oxysporum f. sp. albedinis]
MLHITPDDTTVYRTCARIGLDHGGRSAEPSRSGGRALAAASEGGKWCGSGGSEDWRFKEGISAAHGQIKEEVQDVVKVSAGHPFVSYKYPDSPDQHWRPLVFHQNDGNTRARQVWWDYPCALRVGSEEQRCLP